MPPTHELHRISSGELERGCFVLLLLLLGESLEKFDGEFDDAGRHFQLQTENKGPDMSEFPALGSR